MRFINNLIYPSNLIGSFTFISGMLEFVSLFRYGDLVFHELGPVKAVSVTGFDTLVDMFGMEVFSGRGSFLEMFGGDNFNAEIRAGHGMHGLIASEGEPHIC